MAMGCHVQTEYERGKHVSEFTKKQLLVFFGSAWNTLKERDIFFYYWKTDLRSCPRQNLFKPGRLLLNPYGTTSRSND